MRSTILTGVFTLAAMAVLMPLDDAVGQNRSPRFCAAERAREQYPPGCPQAPSTARERTAPSTPPTRRSGAGPRAVDRPVTGPPRQRRQAAERGPAVPSRPAEASSSRLAVDPLAGVRAALAAIPVADWLSWTSWPNQNPYVVVRNRLLRDSPAQLQSLGLEGNARALTLLGDAHALGIGMPVNEAEAVRLYRRAAELGEARAQNNLGYMYGAGRGIGRDDVQAIAWRRRAADQGFADAQHGLGYMYLAGLGTARNPTQAVEWYRRAADQGMTSSQFAVGALLYDGRSGVAQDRQLGLIYVRRAANSGDDGALAWLRERNLPLN
jgi:TPR repeat protein